MKFELKSGSIEINFKPDLVMSDYAAVTETAFSWLTKHDRDAARVFRKIYFFAAALHLLTDYDVGEKTIDDLTELYDVFDKSYIFEEIPQPLWDAHDAYIGRVEEWLNKKPADKMFDALTELVNRVKETFLSDEVKDAIRDILTDENLKDGFKALAEALGDPETLKALTAAAE